jgi:cytochrome d ubiquinol oxidase subunit II
MDAYLLAIIFAALTGLSVVIYALLDGYDLGVGILFPVGNDRESEAMRDTMIASIGPFWDANETWLVLAIGLLLIAFPAAHSMIMYHLYLPIVFMLIGLIMRGVAFDFRAKAVVDHKYMWDMCFKFGSILTSLSQGYMLGLYVVGFESSILALGFACVSALGVTSAYAYIGSAWLIMKTEHNLQERAVKWTQSAGRLTATGILAVSVINPLVNATVLERWFQMPFAMFVLLIPVLCIAAFIVNDRLLTRLPKPNDRHAYWPFLLTTIIFIFSFLALAFSFMPDIVPGKMTIWQAASAPESLIFILYGAVIVIPVILAYTFFTYKIFHGKATDLKYY